MASLIAGPQSPELAHEPTPTVTDPEGRADAAFKTALRSTNAAQLEYIFVFSASCVSQCNDVETKVLETKQLETYIYTHAHVC